MKELFEFLMRMQELKEIKRSGWELRGIEHGENIPDHMFSVALMAFVFAERKNLNTEKAMKLALVHDICEVISGDISTRMDENDQPMSNKQKHAVEENALKELIKELEPGLKNGIMQLWEEFEKGESEEAKLVKQLDKMDMALQALYYEKHNRNKKSLDEFFGVCKKKIKDEELVQILELIISERKINKEMKN